MGGVISNGGSIARGTRGTAILRAVVLAAAGAWVSVSLSGCGKSDLTRRFEIERDLWNAGAEARRVLIAPVPDSAEVVRAAERFERILDAHPIEGSDPQGTVLAVRSRAAVKAAEMYRRRNLRSRAVSVLWEEKEAQKGRLTAIPLYDALLASVAPDTTERLLREMYETLPASMPGGAAVGPVIEAPLRRARLLAAVGRRDEALGSLDEAVDYFSRVAKENAGTETAIVAMLQKAEVQAFLEQPQEAEATLEEALQQPGAEAATPKIRHDLAVVRWTRTGDALAAAGDFEALAAEVLEGPVSIAATSRAADAWAAADSIPRAVAALDRVAEQVGPDDPEDAARSNLKAAILLLRGGRDREGIDRLEALIRRHPRTESGMRARLALVEHYGRTGDASARAAALREAAVALAPITEERVVTQALSETILKAHLTLAEVRMLQGDPAAAAEVWVHLASAMPNWPGAPGALLRAATIQLRELRNEEAARAIARRVVEVYPRHPAADEAREFLENRDGRDAG